MAGEEKRVLIVDDSADTAHALAILISHLGHKTQVCYDGIQCLKALATFAPDCIFLDIGMPGMDGFEVARKIRADPRSSEIHIIALTGYAFEGDLRMSMRSGINVHVSKPIEPELLGRLLQYG